MDNKTRAKSRQKFYCEKCDYICIKPSDYTKHLVTSKHKMIMMDNKNSPFDELNKVSCICGKKYNHMSGLCKHKKKCTQIIEPITEDFLFESHDNTEHSQNNNAIVNVSNDTLIELLKQNNEFKELLVEQNKMIIDLSSKTTTTVINNNNNNSNSNNTMNNKFNLNVFLNETCKDAININDFVKSLQITSADFERFGKNGFVEGISNIMVKGLNKLELCKRPIHCSDLKRETIHLKEDNGWAKETDDGSKLKKVIKQIKHKNIDYTDAWKEENPEYKDFESKVHERYMKIINESMGGYNNEEDEVFYNKIIKNVAKETTIKK